jgi:hypothetical protein
MATYKVWVEVERHLEEGDEPETDDCDGDYERIGLPDEVIEVDTLEEAREIAQAILTLTRSRSRFTSDHRPVDACARCSGTLVFGWCQDKTCPFSDHVQWCHAGWQGHPQVGDEHSCTCSGRGQTEE